MAMLLPLLMAVGLTVPSSPPYSGPPPDHPFWKDIVARAGVQPLATHGAFRLIKVSLALLPATVVTVVPTAEGARVDVRVVQDRRKAGAAMRSRKLSQDRYDILSQLAKVGLWGKTATAPTGKPEVTDGVLWYLEGSRKGERYAIVRHEPNDPEICALCAEFMSIIGEPDEVPHP